VETCSVAGSHFADHPLEMDDEKFRKHEVQGLKPPKDEELAKTYNEAVKKFQKISTYISGQYDEDSGYQELLKHIEELEGGRQGSKANRMFYLALPPSVFTPVAKRIKKNVYSQNGINRIIIEKPFGKDFDSCRELLTSIKEDWSENETYRIDHYLGKEMVKNMLVMRFGNVIFDACFNKNFVSNVQITFKEPFGTEGRGGYFDEFGIIRDVCQNRRSSTWISHTC
jgi:glucose-6-phosphate 1-dehydrogenase